MGQNGSGGAMALGYHEVRVIFLTRIAWKQFGTHKLFFLIPLLASLGVFGFSDFLPANLHPAYLWPIGI
jgi:hypothetical protein